MQSLVYLIHMSVIVLYNGWHHSISILITEITLRQMAMHVCQHVISFVCLSILRLTYHPSPQSLHIVDFYPKPFVFLWDVLF
jgi:hypothetical protein